MLASIATFAIEGVESREVTVEVDVRAGLPSFTVVGLPGASVREARERVRSALLNSGFEFPLKRITANLAPADLPKIGPSFDLALAVGVLAASGQLADVDLSRWAVCGELSLSGELRPVPGAVAIASSARERGYSRLIVASENAGEAALAEGLSVYGVETIERLVGLLLGELELESALPAKPQPDRRAWPDLEDVRGQEDARRALEIAAAGGHNLLMIGPPGAGKTMLARRLPGILPPPALDEALEITRIHSVAGISDGRLASERPFRAPHHSISASGLVGGGARPRPGEITLAHRGVLFLDELAEFSRLSIEALRQPLEDRSVEIVRGQRSIRFPAAAMLVAATNPCPCGRSSEHCECDHAEKLRYQRRLASPFVDRIDIVCAVDRTGRGQGRTGERSEVVAARVARARALQERRLSGDGLHCNAEMGPAHLRRHAHLERRLASRLADAVASGRLSERGHDRVLRLARTIADLEGRERIDDGDLDEALAYRPSLAETVLA